MSDRTAIEWTHATWNPVRGCTKVSPGCKHCYAETFAERFRGVPGHPFEQGFDLRLVSAALELPLRWKTARLLFVNSMSDLFDTHEAHEYHCCVPRTVRVAVATSCVIALLGVVSIAVSIGDLLSGGSVRPWLGVRNTGLLLSPLYASALALPLAAVRRDGRVRELSFHLALFAALLVGLVALFTLVLAALMGRVDARVGEAFFVFALAVVVAWSLSRPSAKAWFTSPPTRSGDAR